MIETSYIICSTGRSGSSLLCTTLRHLGSYGRPKEYFHENIIKTYDHQDDAQKFQDYLSEVLSQGTTSNGIFGVKMHWDQLRGFLKLARKYLGFSGKTDQEILAKVFPNTRFIYIWRRNLIKQAISTEIAIQTGQWVKNQEIQQSEPTQKLVFKPLNLYRCKQALEIRNQKWEKFFEQNSSNFYEIVYEDFIESFENTIIELIDFLDIQPLPARDQIKMLIERQSNHINEKWYHYYSYIPENLLKIYDQTKLLAHKSYARLTKELAQIKTVHPQSESNTDLSLSQVDKREIDIRWTKT